MATNDSLKDRIRTLTDGRKTSEQFGRGFGSLVFWKRGGKVRVYFRYTSSTGSQEDYPLGLYDEKGQGGMQISEAKARAWELSKLYQSGVKDIKTHFAEQDAAREAEKTAAKEALEAARREREARGKFTLGALCGAYVAHLEALGKPSAKDAANAFKNHVSGASPELAATPAMEVQPEQIASLIRSIRDKGKDRMAGIVRSYLNAAYQMAIGAKFDTSAPASFNGFEITQNPVAPIKAIAVKRGERVLSQAELREYFGHMGEGIVDQALLLALLAGGQRIRQLLRARVADWDPENRVLRLWDSKGKRTEAREHLLPLGEQGAKIVDALVERAMEKATKAAQGGEPEPNPSLWLSTAGAVVFHATPGKRVVEIAKRMKGESFDLRDLRRTCETRLAGLGITREVRAQLLSHGLSGVQVAHYDRHSYSDEKRAALDAWEAYLFSKTADNVIPMKRAAAA
ncbi:MULTISPECIES: site-specific integrase [Thiorhodovibrio]|uniref:site-specific integrase n=1 Tax=Thiorhodovibrio TaxID=61593 RepID=UPI0019118153|nr:MULTISPECIES: tyrosine-type recombinase/integrase [Thiorhodovibrio]MBK5969775.1 hypothetical protein [Thiorhodovibrio winogradskyi]WPL12183.1 Site-specific recombinase XerD [Thiorhodovibrio litoralis]